MKVLFIQNKKLVIFLFQATLTEDDEVLYNITGGNNKKKSGSRQHYK